MITVIEFNNIGAISSEAAVSVDENPTVYTITAGKKGISFQNLGSKPIWYGGSNLDPDNNIGNKIFSNGSLVYKGVKSTFQIYFACLDTESSTLGVVHND